MPSYLRHLKRKRSVLLMAGLGGLFTAANLASAQNWTATSAPHGWWRSVATSADGIKLVAAGLEFVGDGGRAPLPIYISWDSGTSWTPTSTPISYNWSSVACSADGTKLVAAQGFVSIPYGYSVPGSIYISADSGATWTQTSAPTNMWTSVAASADGTTLLAAGGGEVYTSHDSGANWIQSDQITGLDRGSVACSADGCRFVAVDSGFGDGLIYTSTNSGATWTQTTAPSNHWSSVASSADGTKITAASGDPNWGFTGSIFTSADSGATWTQTTLPDTNWWASVASSADGRKLMAATYYDIYTSADSGATWTRTAAPFELISVASSADGSKLVAGGHLIWTSSYYGPWKVSAAPFTNFNAVASSADGTKLMAAGGVQIYASASSGSTWTVTSAPINFWNSIASSADGTKLVATTSGTYSNGYWNPGGRIYTTANSGETWTLTSAPSSNWVSIACSADGTKLVAVASNGRSDITGGAIFLSTDSGASWHQSAAPATNWWSSVASSADGTKLVAVSGGDGAVWSGTNLVAVSTQIFTSTDSGTTWTQANSPSNTWWSVACSADGHKLVAAGAPIDPPGASGNIYISPDSGATWTKTEAPASYLGSVASSADGTKLVAAGYSGVIYTSRNSGATWTQANSPGIFESLTIASSADGDKLVATAWSNIDGVDGGHIYTLQFPLPPTASPSLDLRRLGNGLNLSWLIPSSRFVVQQNPDLTTTNWTDTPTLPAFNYTNLHYEMRFSPSLGSGFYRLKQQ